MFGNPDRLELEKKVTLKIPQYYQTLHVHLESFQDHNCRNDSILHPSILAPNASTRRAPFGSRPWRSFGRIWPNCAISRRNYLSRPRSTLPWESVTPIKKTKKETHWITNVRRVGEVVRFSRRKRQQSFRLIQVCSLGGLALPFWITPSGHLTKLSLNSELVR